MALDLTFQQVKDFVKKDQPDLIEAVDRLLGLTLICSPIIFGPAAAPLLGLLTVKNELTKIGLSVFKAITGKNDADYLGHQERLKAAYVLICYTSYFEALDRQLPESFRKRLSLSAEDKNTILKMTRERTEPATAAAAQTARAALAKGAQVLSFPHPARTFDGQKADLKPIYGHLTKGLIDFFEKLAVWDECNKEQKDQVLEALKSLPDLALTCFDAQYCELATRFEDFGVWANLHEHQTTRQLIEKLSEYVKQRAAFGAQSLNAIDVGFAQLRTAVQQIPHLFETARAMDVVEALRRHYDARVNEQIIEDKYESEEGKPRLSFPKIKDAFIPQSYRALVYNAQTRRLESEDTWQSLPQRGDLGAFLLSYLSSPYSIESPLIILGHPGSGKSLLTKILSATLLSEQYTPIRVALREVDSEASIPSQIEQYVNSVTADKIDSWARFSSQFKNTPPVIILDGYDELLQASGKVFSGYLKDARNFQKSEAEQNRPVRIIVTSRLTLIDKAAIPEGATIIRLLEFDKKQREAWIGIWNSQNQEYFALSGVEPFTLPDEKAPNGKSVLNLAEQPLLLLMLALYDSEDNRLKKRQGLDRTVLYDSLLRRFVLRERSKRKDFLDLPLGERDEEVDRDIQRLGVASIAMYNRRKLHILSSELDEDVKCFDLERQIVVENGRPLTQADMLLGSFFFVHKSKVLQKTEEPHEYEETSAFEFLHNTFGEFLTADFILRQAVSEVQLLRAFRTTENLRAELVRRLDRPDAFSKAWYASLIYTPLFSRPVVLEMLREWVGHHVRVKHLAQAEFLAGLDEIVLNQIQRTLVRRHMPPLIRGDLQAPFPKHSMLGHLAIYTINLVTLRTVLSPDGFVFDESHIGSHEDGTRPWDQLTFLWRSWFSLEHLNGLTAIMSAERLLKSEETGGEESRPRVRLTPKKAFQLAPALTALDSVLNVSATLADNVLTGLAGLHRYNPGADNRISLDTIYRCLEAEGIDVGLQVAVKALLDAPTRHSEGGDLDRVRGLLDDVLRRSLEEGRVEELHVVLGVLATRFRTLGARMSQKLLHSRRFLETRGRPDVGYDLVRMVLLGVGGGRARGLEGDEWPLESEREFRHVHPRHLLEIVDRFPEFGVSILRSVYEGGFSERSDYWQELREYVLHRGFLEHMAERNPEAALELLQIIARSDGSEIGSRVSEELWARLRETRALERVARFRPDLIVDLARWIPPEAGRELWERYSSALIAGILSPRTLTDVVDRRPDVALLLLRELHSHADESSPMRLKRGNAEGLLHPRFLIEVCDRNPQVGMELLRAVRRWISTPAMVHYLDGMHEYIGVGRRLQNYLNSDPSLVLELLDTARAAGSERMLEALSHELAHVCDTPEAVESLLERSSVNHVRQVIGLLRSIGNMRAAHNVEAAAALAVGAGGN